MQRINKMEKLEAKDARSGDDERQMQGECSD
jgi:hypothetical protein